ncbi:unnamed protein product [Cladocopium goreaui]|uniref:Retrotransposon gag domain-containing protein n=1 Tax=Cladocopium goreaui TaxID=2562237 RepID=A0A9P1D4S5_9DINO|nr:unnamed protein product [Cladocopium goreaui]
MASGGHRADGDVAEEHEESEPDRERPRPEALDGRNDDEQGESEHWGGWSHETPGTWWGNRHYGGWWSWHWDDWRHDWEPRRDEKVARVEETTWAMDGRWVGGSSTPAGESWRTGDDGASGKPTEKMVVAEFDGDGGENELGTTARSYLRKVGACLRCTKLPERERGLALYTHLKGRAWVFAEELDLDRLGAIGGAEYYLGWVRIRFMEMEVNKVASVMTELFKKCRRKPEQAVRDFNMEFERLLLRLGELNCELPALVKAWLYLDESDEALLASVNNQYDLRCPQQAAIIHDRGVARRSWERPGNGGRWKQQSVHVTAAGDDAWSDEHDGDAGGALDDHEESDAELVEEDVASGLHSAFMAFQDAKSRCREAMKGRGMDREEMKKRSEERLCLAKARSYCSACKRKGHWHRMCYMTADVDIPEETYGERETVVFMAGDAGDGGQRAGGGERPCALAIADTACTKTVAGHQWYEDYCRWADDRGLPIEIVEEKDQFKFGASRIHPSMFAIWAIFEVGGKLIRVKVAIVQCRVPLLFSRTVLAKLGMVYHVGAQRADLTHLGLFDLEMAVSETGHPAFVVTDIGDRANCGSEFLWSGDPEVQLCDSSVVEQYMAEPIHAGDHVNGADFTIAHEQGGVDPRAGCIADSHPPEVDSPRAQADGDRAPPAEDGEEETAIKGLGRMTLDELKAKCTEHSLRVPTKATRGLLIKMLRHASQPSGDQVMNFGKYKSWMYKEVPVDYLRWAVWESEANDTAGDDLCDHSGPEGGGIFRAMQQLVAGVFKGNSKEGIVRGGIGGVGNGCGVAGGGTSGTAEAGDRDRAGEAEVPDPHVQCHGASYESFGDGELNGSPPCLGWPSQVTVALGGKKGSFQWA